MLSEKLVPRKQSFESFIIIFSMFYENDNFLRVSPSFRPIWQNCGHPGLLVRQIFAILLGSGNLHQYVGPFVGWFHKKGRGLCLKLRDPQIRAIFS